MAPTLSTHDAADCGLTNAVLRSDLGLLARVCSDLRNLVVREFREAMPFAVLARSMRTLVGIVGRACSPAEIFRRAVRPISVVMGALHSVGAGAVKCRRDENMHVERSMGAINRKIYSKVAALRVGENRSYAPRYAACSTAASVTSPGFAPDSPEVADREKAFKADDRFPDFAHARKNAMTVQQLQLHDHGAAKNCFVAG